MITVTQIRGGKDYVAVHLSANDYYSEGESVTGIWLGKGAEMLGLRGTPVESEAYQALEQNKNPATGEKLTPRMREVKAHDTTLSASKSYSIMAMVAGDDRLVRGFQEVVEKTFRELEKHAAVRDRRGARVYSEAFRTTGNAVCAVFHHDTSRLLDPQLHAHLVFSNLSYDEGRGTWLALQPRPMMEESKRSIRRFFNQELARVATRCGYEVEWTGQDFRLSAVSRATERAFSQRAVQRDGFIRRYQNLFGREPDKARVEAFIKEGQGPGGESRPRRISMRIRTHPQPARAREFRQRLASFQALHLDPEQGEATPAIPNF